MSLKKKKLEMIPKRKKSFCDVVLDLGFGDAGKGRVVDWLCSNRAISIVVRFNGGHQAGHGVHHNDIEHTFSNFGSGTLRGVPTYWGSDCTVDPIGLLKEYNILVKKGINPAMLISGNSPIATPLDKDYNILQENKNNHGSVGVGFGTTIQREEDNYSFRFRDLFYDDIFKYKMEMVERYYRKKTIHNWKNFIAACEQIKNHAPAILLRNSVPHDYESYIYEGAQGLLLDQNKGFFPHVTRSNTGLDNIGSLKKRATLWLVTRAYQTRHGNGPMTNLENDNNIFIKDNPHEKNKANDWQGKFRKSVLDLSLLEYSIRSHGLDTIDNKKLVITCLDNLEKYCLTYRGKDHIFGKWEEFVIFISDTLTIPEVYISKSPGPEPIQKF
jgi:adenylosuccinate synthase